jgi:hypothetical protein
MLDELRAEKVKVCKEVKLHPPRTHFRIRVYISANRVWLVNYATVVLCAFSPPHCSSPL